MSMKRLTIGKHFCIVRLRIQFFCLGTGTLKKKPLKNSYFHVLGNDKLPYFCYRKIQYNYVI